MQTFVFVSFMDFLLHSGSKTGFTISKINDGCKAHPQFYLPDAN